MKYTYKVIETETLSGVIETIKRSDGAYIPMDEGNSDYQAYLNPDKVEHLTEIPTS